MTVDDRILQLCMASVERQRVAHDTGASRQQVDFFAEGADVQTDAVPDAAMVGAMRWLRRWTPLERPRLVRSSIATGPVLWSIGTALAAARRSSDVMH
ncbi:MAG: hypothetical protein EOO24_04335 [Comamonadaceae bacterium]|nr:MAG: hypothetical protein EOO24_04335 [Comamonadaceae bacterium]